MRIGNKRHVGIIGLGRFGQLLAQLLQTQFKIYAYDAKITEIDNSKLNELDIHLSDLDTIYQCDTLFIAVPIREFEPVLKTIYPHLSPTITILDVCSVKIHPVKIMQKYLPKTATMIATHPLFGPDSINNPQARKIMMHHVHGSSTIYSFWKNFFKEQLITVIEMTPDQHDQLAAKSQGITHFIGRTLDNAQFETTEIDTQGFQTLLKLKQQTCNDSWELFFDLQRYNPYTEQYIKEFIHSANTIYRKIAQDKQIQKIG